MSAQTLSSAQLLTCSDADFDSNIKNMAVKDLMTLISCLQKEMAKEQENFNGMSSALQGLKDRKSRQYKTISADMVKAQAKLTTLMNRSMKCFSQQNLQQNNQEVPLRRRNSTKSSEVSNSSPSKSASVQRSRSMHSTNQSSDNDNTVPVPTSQTSNTAQSSARRWGGVTPVKSRVAVQQRPASVAGVNGVVSQSKGAASGVGSRESLGYTPGNASTSSTSMTSLNIQPQAPVVVGSSLTDDQRPRSKSQIIMTPSPIPSQPSHASSPPRNVSSPLSHASSQPSLASSSQEQAASASPPEKGFQGLPSVRHLAQTFGGKSNASGENNTAATSSNYRPVIRAKSMAASDASQGPVMIQSSSSKVNGIPTVTGPGGRIQGQYIKRTAPSKLSNASAPVANSQTELEKVHARLQASREINLPVLPDKEAPIAVQNGDREISFLKTNLDRKKSSSSILLGQKTDFEEEDTSFIQMNSARAHQESQFGPMRRAQSREEVYAIESNARTQKDAMLKEIGSRKATSREEKAAEPVTSSAQWGLKGSTLLAQRLQQDEQERAAVEKNEDVRQKSSKVSVQVHPALPGSAGLAVTILSTSRENLTDIAAPNPTVHKLRNITPAKDNKSQPSSLASKHPSGHKVETTAAATAKTMTVPASSKETKQQRGAENKSAVPPEPVQTCEEVEDFSDLIDENAMRMNLINWDPKPVLEELYKIKLVEETAEDISHQFVSMEGLMEKLPMNKKKSTLLKTWKRRFFRAKDGWLQYFETGNRDKPSETLQLMGGHVDDMGNRILGIDDGRGHYLMVRAPTDREHGQWKVALESQTADNTKATYVKPLLRSLPHSTKQVVVIDLGSSAIRAGVLGAQESLPQVFFPSVVAVNRETGKKVVGIDSYCPDVRKKSTLLHPIRPSNRVDQFNIDVDMMTAIFSKVFNDLGVDPKHHMVMLSTPQTLSDSLRAGLMKALVDSLGVQGVCMVQQSLLALYSYRTTTGVIVDIGHRIEILPIYDGFVIEGGVSRCPYGSQKVIDSLKKSLLETNFKFASEVELLLVQHIMQQSCYVAYDYKEEDTLCETQPGKLRRTINMDKFNLPEGAYRNVEVEEGRFSSPEGFFNVDLWEMDYPTLHKLIFQAIQSCPMDNRRHMYRAIYLSGGVTMLPGFQERLHTELCKLAPSAVTVEVHAAPNRYHAAYLGACSVASMPQFKDMAISRDEWHKEGVRAFRKWQAPSS